MDLNALTLMNVMLIHVILLLLAPTLMVVLNVLVLLDIPVTVFLVMILMNALLEPITAVPMDLVQILLVDSTANVIVDMKVTVSNVQMLMSAVTHHVTNTHIAQTLMAVSLVNVKMDSAVKVLVMMSMSVTKIHVTATPLVTT